MVQISSMLVAAVLSCSGFLSVSALAMERDVALVGKTIVPATWRGILEEGKPMVYLSGSSYDDIEAQAKALNPAYTIFAEKNSTAEQDTGLSARDLNARAIESIHCGWPPNYSPAPSYWTPYGSFSYLENMKGDCGAPAGPGGCARVTCEEKSAIYFCNDNRNTYWEPCRYVGIAAGQVWGKCAIYNTAIVGGGSCHGQAFVDRGWNAIIARGDC